MDTFEREFQRVTRHSFTAGEVSSIDLKPNGWEKFPTIVFAPGWLGTFLKYEPVIREVYNSGRRVVSVEYSRVGGEVPHSKKYFEIEIQKSQMLLGVLREKSLKNIHLLSHSEGAINSLLAVVEAPDIFQKIILINPAGFIKKDNFILFLIRFMLPEKRREVRTQKKLIFNLGAFKKKDKETQSIIERSKAISKELLRNILKNPIRFFLEAHAISESSIYENLYKAKKQGINIGMIIGDNDKVFPEKRIVADLASEEQKRGMKIVDILKILPGEHSDLASLDHSLADIDKDAHIELETQEYISVALGLFDDLSIKTI